MAGPLRPPRALLLDLDDTLVVESSGGDDPWEEHLPRLAAETGAEIARLRDALAASRRHFWSDPERHRRGRLDMHGARREVVAGALQALGVQAREVGRAYADAVSDTREARMRPFPGALEALGAFRRRGLRLALLTNGGAPAQRRKIARFGLAAHFDAVLVEGELGFGKPDRRVFERALRSLEVDAASAWMVGNDLASDVGGARAAGLHAVWVDARGTGLPADAAVRPDRIVRAVAELVEVIGMERDA
ncbi:MAG: HAD family hydrolase [Myxococcota bacterium]|nr:HAD family hydrolase [Myxococcota bacterium]